MASPKTASFSSHPTVRTTKTGSVPPQSRRQRPAPSPPTRAITSSEASAFQTIPRPARPRNLFEDFIATLPRPFPLPAAVGGPEPALLSPSSPMSSSPSYSSLSLTTASLISPATSAPSPHPRTPSLDVMLELYSHTRHPLDLRTHLTILPSWGVKANKERKGECVICYCEDEHLQVQWKQ